MLAEIGWYCCQVIRVGKKEHQGSFFVQKLTSRKWSPEWVEGDLVQSKILVESGGSWKENPDLLDMLVRFIMCCFSFQNYYQ